eukprot:UN23741
MLSCTYHRSTTDFYEGQFVDYQGKMHQIESINECWDANEQCMKIVEFGITIARVIYDSQLIKFEIKIVRLKDIKPWVDRTYSGSPDADYIEQRRKIGRAKLEKQFIPSLTPMGPPIDNSQTPMGPPIDNHKFIKREPINMDNYIRSGRGGRGGRGRGRFPNTNNT